MFTRMSSAVTRHVWGDWQPITEADRYGDFDKTPYFDYTHGVTQYSVMGVEEACIEHDVGID